MTQTLMSLTQKMSRTAIEETESHYLLRLDLNAVSIPGKKIEIELTEDDLIISSRGQRKKSEDPSISIKITSLKRLFAAFYEAGVLTLALPKVAQNERLVAGVNSCHY
jgi:HSP20 family molecular chaperone IbpA